MKVIFFILLALCIQCLAQNNDPGAAPINVNQFNTVAQAASPSTLGRGGCAIQSIGIFPTLGHTGRDSMFMYDFLGFSPIDFTDVPLNISETLLGAGSASDNETELVMVIGYGAQTFVKLVNLSVVVTTENKTQQNCTEVKDADGNLVGTPVCYGNYTITLYHSTPTFTTVSSSNLTTERLIGAAVVDKVNRFAYFVSASSSPILYRVNLTDMTMTQKTLGTDLGFSQVLRMDMDRQLIYLLATNNGQSTLTKLDVTDFPNKTPVTFSDAAIGAVAFGFTDPRYYAIVSPLGANNAAFKAFDLNTMSYITTKKRFPQNQVTLPAFVSPRYAVEDPVNGFAYFISFSNPPQIAKLNFLTFTTQGFTTTDVGARSTFAIISPTYGTLVLAASMTGAAISYPAPCLNFCSGVGTCGYGGLCTCPLPWAIPDCSTHVCPNGTVINQSCSGAGACNDGTCECFPGYEGTLCETFLCPAGCSNHGTCNRETHECTCERQYNGTGCETELSILPCHLTLNCDECSANPACTWCQDMGGVCLLGNSSGPTSDTDFCFNWYYMGCPQIGFWIAGIIFQGICGILIGINIVTAFMEDWGGADAVRGAENTRAAWWRVLRSNKAWFMLDRFQIIAMTGMLAGEIPTHYLQYTRIFQWTVIFTRLPWIGANIYDPSTVSTRALANFEQGAHTWGTNPITQVVPAILFVTALIVAAMGIWRLALLVIRKKMFPERHVYACIRIFLFIQPALVLVGAYGTVTSMIRNPAAESRIGIGLGIPTVVIFGLLPIGAILFFFCQTKFVPHKRLFEIEFRKKFAALYSEYKFDKSWFSAIAMAKRVLIAMWFGFIYVNAYAVLILAMVTTVGYGVVIVILGPYLETMNAVAEIAVLFTDLFVYGLCFGFVTNGLITPHVISILIVVAHGCGWGVCLLVYFVQWMRVRNIQNVGQLCGKK